jgi:hypothetical protein
MPLRIITTTDALSRDCCSRIIEKHLHHGPDISVAMWADASAFQDRDEAEAM